MAIGDKLRKSVACHVKDIWILQIALGKDVLLETEVFFPAKCQIKS